MCSLRPFLRLLAFDVPKIKTPKYGGLLRCFVSSSSALHLFFVGLRKGRIKLLSYDLNCYLLMHVAEQYSHVELVVDIQY